MGVSQLLIAFLLAKNEKMKKLANRKERVQGVLTYQWPVFCKVF